MSEPKIAARQPAAVELEAGKSYAWCRCGGSKAQPFCDGSHRGTGIVPLVWKAEESTAVELCQCKRTKSPPFCDGTHETL